MRYVKTLKNQINEDLDGKTNVFFQKKMTFFVNFKKYKVNWTFKAFEPEQNVGKIIADYINNSGEYNIDFVVVINL